MKWYQFIEAFFAGLFLANSVPHFVKGICGDKFPTPFAKPPGQGLSSPTVNVIWGLFNIAVGYLLFRLADIQVGCIGKIIVFFAGVAVISIMMSSHFSKKHKE